LKKYLDVANYLSANMQKSCSDTLYSGLHKNDKCVDLDMYIFKPKTFIRFSHCVAHDTKKFVLKFHMLVGYIIDYM
jgi:hypothetical protein